MTEPSKLPSGSESQTLRQLAEAQDALTKTVSGKIWQFFRIVVLRRSNTFEQYVLRTEPNDCSLTAKYSKVKDIDLSNTALSVDLVTLATIHIPHPLVGFSKNEVNKARIGTTYGADFDTVLGESPVLLFIHGLGGQMSQFEPLMALLSQCSEIVSLDLPGFGNSRLEFSSRYQSELVFTDEEKKRISLSVKLMLYEDYQSNNIASIILAFVEQNIPKEKKVLLIGHSMGTHLAVKVASRLPKHKVEGLILLSPPPFADDILEGTHIEAHSNSASRLLKVFTFVPWLFNLFRVWDRLEGLQSTSVLRQISETDAGPNNIYVKTRQLRWNMDISSWLVLRYVSGFNRARYSDLITAINNFNDNPADQKVYEKTLIIGGAGDKVTPVLITSDIDSTITKVFNKKNSSVLPINNVGHSLLLSKPEFISGKILNHLESKFPERLHLSPLWVLKVKAQISGDKWGMKNKLKWLQLNPISGNITRYIKDGSGNDVLDVAPLLGMKTLRQGDWSHSPSTVELHFYETYSADEISDETEEGSVVHNSKLTGTLVAIVDISADIPPYNTLKFKHIQYYKCATVSKVVPDSGAIRRFTRLIDDILAGQENVDNPLIGVHCHYGFNRTGFLICCYLIERLRWSVQEAVDGFKSARSPGIKHPHFVDALYVRYDNVNETGGTVAKSHI